MLEDMLKLDVIEHVPEYAEAMKMAVSALKENQQHHGIEAVKARRDNDGWIPEKEKPPEKKSVLMCDAAGCRDVGWWNGQKWKTGFSHADNFEAIAWMPLASPYKPAKGDANGQEQSQTRKEIPPQAQNHHIRKDTGGREVVKVQGDHAGRCDIQPGF